MNKLPGFLLAALCGCAVLPLSATAAGLQPDFSVVDHDRSYLGFHRDDALRGARAACPPGLAKPERGCVPRRIGLHWPEHERFVHNDRPGRDRFGHDWRRKDHVG